jgi:lycopene beta-cyclase
MEKKYHYLIAGGGMAGLSLAYYLSQSEKLKGKKILILDTERKIQNDRTWCFWERGENHPFEKILFRKWQKLDFLSPDFSSRFTLKNYHYKMLRGIDFYRFVYENLDKNPCIEFVYETVKKIEDTPEGAIVYTENQTFKAGFVFDSTFQPDFQQAGFHALLQHFKGWLITTPEPVFEPDTVVLHDFRTEQQQDEARFFYLLPLSPTEALVEYTLFSPLLLASSAYDEALQEYIGKSLKIKVFEVKETEFGVIPMSDVPVAEQAGRHIVRIGTAGGYVRPATGYTFARTQRFLQKIVSNLETSGNPHLKTGWFSKRFGLYDSIMLRVLTRKMQPGAEFFSRLYKKNDIEAIFDFLDEQSAFGQELRLMSTVKLKAFIPAAFSELRKRIFRC